jgi:hypothetical protein
MRGGSERAIGQGMLINKIGPQNDLFTKIFYDTKIMLDCFTQ